MNNSSTAIANAALSHIGVSKLIADIDTDKSAEALACRQFFDQARAETLRDFAWPFARKFVSLQLVEEQPTNEWLYSYRIPADNLKIRRILNGMSRFETRESRIPYIIGGDDEGGLIYSDIVAPATLEYTWDITDLSRFPPDVNETISLLLAFLIAPRVTGGDKYNLGKRALEVYQWRLIKARENAANEEQPDDEGESELITVRG